MCNQQYHGTNWNCGKYLSFPSCFREVASALSLWRPAIVTEGEGNHSSAQASIFIFYLVTFLNYISVCPLPYTNIRQGKISAPISLHVAHGCTAIYDVGIGFLFPWAFTWHLPFSARRLCCAPSRMKPIVLSILLLKPKDASAITIDFSHTANKDRENVTIYSRFVPSPWLISECVFCFLRFFLVCLVWWCLSMWAWLHMGSWIFV